MLCEKRTDIGMQLLETYPIEGSLTIATLTSHYKKRPQFKLAYKMETIFLLQGFSSISSPKPSYFNNKTFIFEKHCPKIPTISIYSYIYNTERKSKVVSKLLRRDWCLTTNTATFLYAKRPTIERQVMEQQCHQMPLLFIHTEAICIEYMP